MYTLIAKRTLPVRSFARFLNRGQQAAVDMKSDMTSYEYAPDMISKLDPAPAYPEPAMLSQGQMKTKRDAAHNLERIRTSAITKKQNEMKFNTGRLYSHYKLEEIRSDVNKIKQKEKETARLSDFSKQRGI